jgi:hypothetical protein
MSLPTYPGLDVGTMAPTGLLNEYMIHKSNGWRHKGAGITIRTGYLRPGSFYECPESINRLAAWHEIQKESYNHVELTYNYYSTRDV